MPKPLFRIVAFALVASLVAGPSAATPASVASSGVVNSARHLAFCEQALASTPIGAQRYSINLRVGLTIIGAVVIGLMAQIGQAQSLSVVRSGIVAQLEPSPSPKAQVIKGDLPDKFIDDRSYTTGALYKLLLESPDQKLALSRVDQLVNTDRPETLRALVGTLAGLNPFARIAAANYLQEKASSEDLIDFIITYLTGQTFADQDPYLSRDIATKWLPILQKSKQLGIQAPFRFSRDTLEILLYNREHNAKDGRPLAVILQGLYDPFRVMATSDRDVVTPLIQQGYRVLLYQVPDPNELTAEWLDATESESASVLVLSGHGSRKRMLLNPGVSITQKGLYITISPASGSRGVFRKFITRGKAQLRRVSAGLRLDGQIILQSCSTGQSGWWGGNLADYLRQVFPKATGIWAPKEVFSSLNIQFNEGHQIQNVTYYDEAEKVPVYRASGKMPELSPSLLNVGKRLGSFFRTRLIDSRSLLSRGLNEAA